MKKLFLAVAAVAMVFATSCKKENVNEPEVPAGDNEFICVIDQNANPQNAPMVEDGMGTMAHIDGSNNVWWQAGDKIMYKGCEAGSSTVSYYELTCLKMAGDGRAYFSDQTGNGYHFYQGAHEAYYPATLYNGTALTLPNSINIDADKNAAFLPMYGTGNGTHYLKFNNMCAVLKITVPVACDKIVLSADQYICGPFSVTNNKAQVTTTSGDNYKTITVNGTFTTDKLVYVAIPENNYSNFKIEFFKGANPLRDKTLASMPVTANQIYPVSTNSCPAPADAFYFERTTSNDGDYIKLVVPSTPDNVSPTLQYCRPGDNVWTDYTNGQNITFGSGNTKIYIRAKGTTNNFINVAGINATKAKTANYSDYRPKCYSFASNSECSVKIGGNIMYLYDKTGNNGTLQGHSFAGLFMDMTTLTDASQITLPSLSGTTYDQFKLMFYGCTGLVNAGFSINFASGSGVTQRMFERMFQGCTALTTAPTINSSANNSTAQYTYYYMFNGCSSLRTITFNVTYATGVTPGSMMFSNWLPSAGSNTCTLKTPSTTADVLDFNGLLYGWKTVNI